ncbi:ComEC/Rec2 family competence protein [Candidatus Gottesmanbacteria bacterium]|nr:ComEC/Rec2 family competence protein [Candidatus Gottesmanbacteria bacterium]
MTIPLSFPTIATFTSVINQLLPEPHAGLLAGISFGTKATLSKVLVNDLIKTGTLHIVALSGMNITIVSSVVSLTLLRLVSRRITSLLTIGMIIGFIWFVGISPSVIRAAIMGILSLLAVIFGRQSWPLFAWILAVSSMLLLNPQWIGDLSFQLSALATLGIILFGSSLNRGGAEVDVTFMEASAKPLSLKSFFSIGNWRGALQNAHLPAPPLKAIGENQGASAKNASSEPKQVLAFILSSGLASLKNLLADDLRVTLAAQVFTIPIILLNFHRISLVSPLSNVAIGWTIGPLTIAGWVVAALGTIWLPLGQVVAWMAWVPLQYLLTVVAWTAKIPFASVGF